MDKFFISILLITGFTLLIIVYYSVQSYFVKRNKRITADKIHRKVYEDGKIYLREYLMTLLLDLRCFRIQWILIYSRRFPEDKIELSFNALTDEIYILDYARQLTAVEQKKVKNLGIIDYVEQTNSILLKSVLNSKIITDVIYYLFEVIHKQIYFMNVKIITSTTP